MQQLDDKRVAEYETYPEPPTYPARVCDVAYNNLIWLLIHLDVITPRQFSYPRYGTDAMQAPLIAKFKAYWAAHQEEILAQIRVKAPGFGPPN